MAIRARPLFLLVLGMATATRASPPAVTELSRRIDERIQAAWTEAGVTPADPGDDATFLRRVSLDVIGRIPTVAEARTFLSDRDGDRRSKRVGTLLASGAYGRHFATFWRRTWLPQADTPRFASLAPGFEDWVATRLGENAPYDRMVHELLVVPAVPVPASRPGPGPVPAPRAFLSASELKPENLAASTTRAFLGISLDCAQCHNHPFARWTRDQFWETAAFFARPAPDPGLASVRLTLLVPETARALSPRLLDGAEPRWPARFEAETGRRVLADWITSADNAYFARNAANRLWAQFFGVGLVEPLDDLSAENAPSHPELLDDLAGAFVASGFNLKYLIEAIVRSRAYQLASTAPPGAALSGEADHRLFGRMTVRGLTGEQLYDSLRVAGGLSVERADLDSAAGPRQRDRFATQFSIERAAHAERSTTQALTLINGRLMTELTTPGTHGLLTVLEESPFLDLGDKLETLFLATLGRLPTGDERVDLVGYLERGGSAREPRQALADVFWALLNSSEFNTNH